jgi:hypothetical protein
MWWYKFLWFVHTSLLDFSLCYDQWSEKFRKSFRLRFVVQFEGPPAYIMAGNELCPLWTRDRRMTLTSAVTKDTVTSPFRQYWNDVTKCTWHNFLSLYTQSSGEKLKEKKKYERSLAYRFEVIIPSLCTIWHCISCVDGKQSSSEVWLNVK